MNRILLVACCAIAVLLLVSCQRTQTPADATQAKSAATGDSAKKSVPVDYKALSSRLASQIAGVRAGDIVRINGCARDLELLENLATEARKLGAFPLVTLSSDRMRKAYFEEVPEKYDSQIPQLEMKLAEMITAQIIIDSSEADDVLAGVPQSRLAAVNKASAGIDEMLLRRNVRNVSVGNGLYPKTGTATQLGLSLEDLAKTFWNSVNTDYSSLQAIGERVKAALSQGKDLRLTSADGTDLKVRIEGCPFFVSDGVISPEDLKRGGPALSAYLPAGEVYCAPLAGTAEGKVVEPRTFYDGKEVTNLTLTFAGGKLTSISGTGPGFEGLKAAYGAGSTGKEIFAVVDFGINPDLHIWPGSKLGSWMQAGMVSVGIGNNTWAGGRNNCAYGLYSHLGGTTVTLDGKTIVENGELKI